MKQIKGLLIDIDGVLILDDQPIDGAVERFNELRESYQVRLLTNTTTKTAEEIWQVLDRSGFNMHQEEIITAPVAAAKKIKELNYRRVFALTNENIKKEFSDFQFTDESPEVIVIGDIGERWDFELINKAFQLIMGGAEIIALHKSKYWKTGGSLKPDIGLFVSGLEFATDKEAIVVGKPNPAFFQSALNDMNLNTEEVLMFGDDIDNDIGGAQRMGISGIQVKTGKYTAEKMRSSDIEPHQIIERFADFDL